MRRHVTPRLAAVGVALAVVAPLPAAAVTAPPTPWPSPSGTQSSPPPSSAGATTSVSAGDPATAPAATTAPALPISVQLRSLTPLAPQPGDVLRLSGTLHNVSGAPVADLRLQLRYRPTQIGSRSEFDDYATGSRTGPSGAFGPLPLPPVVADTATATIAGHVLAPGATEPFSVAVKVDDLHLPRAWQVYELGVQVNAGFNPVGGLRTFLPWAPVGVPGVGLPTQVAWVWPLVDRPHRTVADSWADNDLAHSLAAGGRLATLLAAGMGGQDQQPVRAVPPGVKKGRKTRAVVGVSPVPVTWAIDPLLVQDIAKMAAGYKIGTGRNAVTGNGTDEARAWLAALKSAVANGETLALPYADPDIVAATRSGLASEVQVAINSGTTSLSAILGTTPLSYAWPPGGFVDQHTLDTLFTAGVSTVVLDGAAVPPVTAPNVTPDAHTTVRARDGNLDALLTDPGLDTVVGIGAQDPTKSALAVQRFLAETLMVQAERPFTQRTLVVTPDRRWAPSPAYAAALASDTGRVPWISPVPLSRALGGSQSMTVARSGLSYPATARGTELDRSYLTDVRALKRDADTFAAILTTGDPHAREFDEAVLRTMSSAWRGQGDAANRFRGAVAAQLDDTMRLVRIASPNGSVVTLTSHSGTVPVTVANELDTPVNVIVAISSQHLKVSGGGRQEQTIPAHRKIAVDVRAEARTSGVFPLSVRLLTRSGRTYDSEQLLVRSTAYGFVAILITAGATGVLLIAVVIRLGRRALAARRPATSRS